MAALLTDSGHTATYQHLGQHWTCTIRLDGDTQILGEPFVTATEVEGESVLIQRIKDRIKQDIAYRKSRQE